MTTKINGRFIFILLLIFSFSCEDMLEVGNPHGQLQTNVVYEDELTATAAVTTLYAMLRDTSLLTGYASGVSVLMGLYTDELDYYSSPGSSLEEFYSHQIIASNDYLKYLWDTSYKLIYMSNAVIEGVEASQSLTSGTKEQLKGEAMFIRSLTYFYLVNLFGDVPYITSTDYIQNKDIPKMNSATVYDFIISDLLLAKSFLNTNYLSSERIRANSYTVSAMLSRVYLYRGQWEKAESESSEIIQKTELFQLENISNEFLINSNSTILQLKPKLDGENTKEAGVFLFENGPPRNVSLNSDFVNSFESEDLRKINWIKKVSNNTDIWYMPFKYKAQEYTGATVEYSILLRLAEQYLIRAEARVHLGNLTGSKLDINIIRNRAGLNNTESISEDDILQDIINERKFELFIEHGHRWFDMKRLDIAEEILAPLKSNWKSTDVLFPIPEKELLTNPNLSPQNPGY